MSIALNHTIVWSRDKAASARFLSEILGLPEPKRFSHFLVVDIPNGVSLDFAQTRREVASQHYAFLVSETDFDAIFGRIRERVMRTRVRRASHAATCQRAAPRAYPISPHEAGRGTAVPARRSRTMLGPT